MKIKSLLNKFSKGFTLIELLIVIAIISILSGGLITLIDPVDKINSAKDAKVQADISEIAKAAEAYAISHNDYYPATLTELVTLGEMKSVPVPPAGYGANYSVWQMIGSPPAPGGPCTSGSTCTGIIIYAPLKSKKFTSVIVNPLWRYESSTGKSCAIATAGFPATFCPP